MERSPDRNDWLTIDDKTFLSQCVFNEYQASGPGGQKRNRKYSGARLRHLPSGKDTTATTSRSQNDNKRAALRKLREKIALEVRCDEKPVVDTLDIGPRNPHRPLLLALLMDTLDENGFRLSDASKELGISTGKLSKLIISDPRMLSIVNKEREICGFPKLRTT